MHKYKILSCKMYCLKYVVWKNSTPKLRGVIGGTITKFHFQATIFFVGPASLQYHGPSKWVWLRMEIKQNHWSILKNKDVIYYQLRPDFLTYGHGPRYTADADAAVTDVCTQKYQVAVWWLLLPQRSSSESNGDMWIKFFMYVTFLRRRGPSQIRWGAWNDGNPLNQCACPLLPILLVARLCVQ